MSKKLIAIAALLIALTMCLVGCADNEFTADISSNDYDVIYDDSDGETVKTIIIPKYDFVDFGYKLIFFGKDPYSEVEKEIKIGNVNAGTQLTHSESISDIEADMNDKYDYGNVTVTSGKKHRKYGNTEKQANTELEFTNITIKDRGGSIYLSCTVKNNTDNYVKEIRKFGIDLQIEYDINCYLYNSRIVLKTELAPHAETTLSDLGGNSTSLGLGSNIEDKKEALRGGLSATSYSNQTYRIIYSKLG